MQKFTLLFVLLIVAYAVAEDQLEDCLKRGNETWSMCGTKCEPLCSKLEVKSANCGEKSCETSCRCAKNYNRHSQGKCVLAKDC